MFLKNHKNTQNKVVTKETPQKSRKKNKIRKVQSEVLILKRTKISLISEVNSLKLVSQSLAVQLVNKEDKRDSII